MSEPRRPSRECPSSRHRVAVALWIAVVLFVSSVPYLGLALGAVTHEPGAIYTWLTPPYPEDGLAYFAWVKQAAEGSLLFKLKYTQVPHTAALFHPFFLAVGWLAALTGWSPGFALFVARIAAVVAFLLVLRRFSAAFAANERERWIGLWLVVLSSGFGHLVGWERLHSADLWMPEFNTLWSLSWNPVFALALCLMLACLDFVLRAEPGRFREPVVAGGLTGLLALIHAYDVLVLVTVVTAIVLWRGGRSGIRTLLTYYAVAAPFCLLQWSIAATHPVLSAHGRTGEMLSPSLGAFAVGLGLPGVLAVGAIVGLVATRRGETLRRLTPLMIWIVAAFSLAYLPLWFQRKLIMGVQIPVCLIAAVSIDAIARRLGGARRGAVAAVAAAAVLLTTPTHRVNLKRMGQQVEADRQAYFVPAELRAGLAYLDTQVPSEAIVLAHYRVARLVPGMTGNAVTLGHWAQTIDRNHHSEWLRRVFSPASALPAEQRLAALRGSRIDYVLVDPTMRRDWLRGPVPDWLAAAGPTLFAESGVRLIRVDRVLGVSE